MLLGRHLASPLLPGVVILSSHPPNTHTHTCLHTVSIAMLAQKWPCSVIVSDSSLQSVRIWRVWSRQQLIVAQVVGVQCALGAARRRRNALGGKEKLMCDMCQISSSPLLSFLISCWALKESWQRSQRLSSSLLCVSGGQTQRRCFFYFFYCRFESKHSRLSSREPGGLQRWPAVGESADWDGDTLGRSRTRWRDVCVSFWCMDVSCVNAHT